MSLWQEGCLDPGDLAWDAGLAFEGFTAPEMGNVACLAGQTISLVISLVSVLL